MCRQQSRLRIAQRENCTPDAHFVNRQDLVITQVRTD